MRNIQNGSMINLFVQAHMNDIKAAARVTLKICRFDKRFGTKTPGLYPFKEKKLSSELLSFDGNKTCNFYEKNKKY